MSKRISLWMLLIVAIFLFSSALQAQHQTGEALVQAAVRELNRTVPNIGEPLWFEYTFSAATADSTLHCPLIEGFDLGYRVVPYRITLIYGSAQYVYHASEDGSILFPCDPKIPIGGAIRQPGQQLYSPASPITAAVDQFAASFPNIGFPDRHEFLILPATTDSSLSCPLVSGTTLSRTVIPYQVSLFVGDTPYIYHTSEDGTMVVPCDPKFANS